MTPASQLIVETTTSGQIGRLEVSGQVSLGGTLTVPLAAAFSAPTGTAFTLIANSGADPVWERSRTCRRERRSRAGPPASRSPTTAATATT